MATVLARASPGRAQDPGCLRKVRGQDKNVGEFVWHLRQITDDPAAMAQVNTSGRVLR